MKPPKPNLRTLLRTLPEPVSRSGHFLLWRREWSEKRGVFVKTPYYTNGRKRFGSLDSPSDLRKLSSLDNALDALENSNGDYDGVGLALVGDGIAAFDIDKCIDANGELVPDHAGRYLAEKAEAAGAYMEVSPSGKGLRILGSCDDFTAYSKAGLEYWGEGRYVTLTGALWANPKGWKDLSEMRATLPSRKKEATPSQDEEEESLVTRRVLEELRSALEAIPSDERHMWIRMGHALKTIGEKGKELWMEWSAKSDLFDEADAEVTWGSLNPSSTGYKAVFAEAQNEWGWENPRTGKGEVEEEEDVGDLLDFTVDLGPERLYPTEFVLDGFLPTGVSLVAGAWGAGKSTNLIPLFASVAHLTPEDWGFHPTLRRHVVWVSEAVDQARDTIYSLTRLEDGAGWEEFRSWFHLVPSRRLKPKTLAKLIKDAVASLTYTLDSGFAVRPVVILDTVSANMDLENESDNSEVGAAMAKLKEALPGVPLVLVGHTPKAITKGDVSEMTFRGAGAWEADASSTYFLVHDPETSMRFLALGKVRFTPDYVEVSFGQDGGRELVATEWGDPQSKAYMHGVPCKSTGEERKAAQAKVREEKKELIKERQAGDRQSRMVEVAAKAAGAPELLTRARLKDLVGGKSDLVTETLRRCVESDLLREVPIPQEVVDRGNFKGRPPETVILPQDVDSVTFFDRIMETFQ